MIPASTRTERTTDPRASAALLTIMLVVAGMTAGMIEHAAARAVESANRDHRLVERHMHPATVRWAALQCEGQQPPVTRGTEEPVTTTGLAHLAGTARALERRLRNLPPPTCA